MKKKISLLLLSIMAISTTFSSFAYADTISTADDQSVAVSSSSGTVINSEIEDFQSAIFPEEMGDKVYSYEELLELAVKNSKEIDKIKKNVEKSEETRDRVSGDYDYIPKGLGSGHPADVLTRQAFLGHIAADTELQVSKKKIEVEEDKIAYKLKTAYNNIISQRIENLLNEKTANLIEKQLKIAEIQYKEGNINRFDLLQKKKSYEEAVEKIASSKIALQQAYVELNDLVGFAPKEEYRLQLESDMIDKVEDLDLEVHISRTRAHSPIIWMAKQQEDLLKRSLSLHSYNAGGASYREKEIDLENAKISVGQSKDLIEQSLRVLYETLVKIEKEREILEINLGKAEENLKLAQLNYDIGYLTFIELDQAKHVVEELNYRLAQLQLQYENTLMVYKKPWVAAQA